MSAARWNRLKVTGRENCMWMSRTKRRSPWWMSKRSRSSPSMTLATTQANRGVCVVVNADDGKVLATLPIGNGTDGGGFNSNTMEAWSSQRDGTLTIIKENSPTSFEIEQ